MNILLLGGAGFIGSHLTKLLIDSGHTVVVFDRAGKDWSNLQDIKEQLIVVTGDFHLQPDIEKIFENHSIDIVIHLISTIVPGTELDQVIADMDLNLHATMKLCQTMAKFSVNKLIFFSSGGTVYGDYQPTRYKETDLTQPINYYGWLKLATEQYIEMQHRSGHLDYLILRPSNAYGPMQKLLGTQGFVGINLNKMKQQQPIDIWGDGSVVRDFIYVEDLVQAVNQVLAAGIWNKIINVGTGTGVSLTEVIKVMEQVTKTKAEVVYKPERQVDVSQNVLDSTKLKHLTGWKPAIALKAGIEKTWEWIRLI